MLYLVATPIGNLSDITLRALEVLKSCDYILCEDTRHSLHLLQHYHIQKPLKSFHKFNEASKEDAILEDLQTGKQIALVSDAGTPGIADPGMRLVKRCIEQNISVTPIPGASAPITALCASGLDTMRFQFIGFLPKTAGKLKAELENALQYGGTTICFESPQRLLKTLELLHHLNPHRKIAIGRELTKQFEEIKQGTAQELMQRWENKTPKGEVVLMIATAAQDEQTKDHSDLSIEEHVYLVENSQNLSRKEAIKVVANIRQVPKRDIYQHLIRK